MEQAVSNTLRPVIEQIVSPLIWLLFGVGVVVFVWGIVEMIMKGGSAEAREKGRLHMFGGLIGMVIMLSAWGIINLISNTLMQFR